MPLVLHTGVASLEGHESPYPERYRVPIETARAVNETHAAGHRVVAIGTTVVRALETVTDAEGTTHPGEGWTDVVITPERGVRAVDGLLTGWHEPEATHLQMLEAVAGRPALELAYREALEHQLPLARVRRQPPAPARPETTVTACPPLTTPSAASPSPPPISTAQRTVLYAAASTGRDHRGPAGRRAGHDRLRGPPTPRRPRATTAWSKPPTPPAGPASAAAPSSGTASPRWPSRSSRRPTASSPTSCSATSPDDAVDAVFDRRRDDRIAAARARLAGHRSFAGRVAEMAAILDEDGYLASFEQADDDLFLVTEHNCAILSVAQAHPHACSQRDRVHPPFASRRRPSNGRPTWLRAATPAPTRSVRPPDRAVPVRWCQRLRGP